MNEKFKYLLDPKSIAVIGASRDEIKVGYAVLNNLIRFGFDGKIFAVNPKADEILGQKVYKSVDEIKEEIDLGVFVIPPKYILQTIENSGQKFKSVIVISAGFKEGGKEGLALEEKLKKLLREKNIPALGPNCLGLINTEDKMNASFSADMPPKGNIAFISQSGALCTSVLDWSIEENVGFSKIISLGNKMDLNEIDFLEILADDPQTEVIICYLEGVTDGPRFIEVASKVTKKIPVVVIKSGGTEAGAKAASSHTGTLAGQNEAYEAAFKQSGVIQVHSAQELFDCALAFSYQPIPKGKNFVVITNAGGPGILATDAIEKSKLEMANISNDTKEELKKHLPPTAALNNPIDVIGDADGKRYRSSIEIVLKDKNVDGSLILLTPQAMTEITETAESICEYSKNPHKPIFASFMGGYLVKTGHEVLRKGKVPYYQYPERAVRAIESMIEYSNYLKRKEEKKVSFDVDKSRVQKIIDNAISKKHFDLGEFEARNIIESYGFKIPKSVLAKDENEAAKAAKELGFPIVMKIASFDVLHKSDVGGVKTGLKNEEGVKKAYLKMVSQIKEKVPKANIQGVYIQEMIEGGKELILGMNKDPQFGPLIMFGSGGIYVEVLKDVSFRVAPLSRWDAESMIKEIKTYPLLTGTRGEEPIDFDALIDALLRLSSLVCDFPKIIELDINPLKIFPKDKGPCVAIDARLSLETIGHK